MKRCSQYVINVYMCVCVCVFVFSCVCTRVPMCMCVWGGVVRVCVCGGMHSCGQ